MFIHVTISCLVYVNNTTTLYVHMDDIVYTCVTYRSLFYVHTQLSVTYLKLKSVKQESLLQRRLTSQVKI